MLNSGKLPRSFVMLKAAEAAEVKTRKRAKKRREEALEFMFDAFWISNMKPKPCVLKRFEKPCVLKRFEAGLHIYRGGVPTQYYQIWEVIKQIMLRVYGLRVNFSPPHSSKEVKTVEKIVGFH